MKGWDWNFQTRPTIENEGMSDEHELVQQLANDLWFKQMDYLMNEGGTMVRRNETSTEEDHRAMASRTKPHTNPWLCLSPRLCTLGQHAFDYAPAVIRESHQYLKTILDVRQGAGATMLPLMQEENTICLARGPMRSPRG